MNECNSEQLQIDFVTGQPTSLIESIPNAAVRAACSALNRDRADGILAAPLLTSQGKSFSANVWDAAFARTTRELKVPLISLRGMGFRLEDEGWICPSSFIPLKPGAEAEPYFHKESRMVYKLFNLRGSGALGKKIAYVPDGEGDYTIKIVDANLKDTLEKIQVLHEMGAHCTEIVGLSDHADYLIVKQPLALLQIYNRDERPFKDAYEYYLEDRDKAIAAICGQICKGHGLRDAVVVGWLHGHSWLISDLHHRNIMREENGAPTIIDALIGPVPGAAQEKLKWLREAVDDAKSWRNTGVRPDRKRWNENYSADEY